MALTFRDIKGSPLTSAEADANIRTLQAAVAAGPATVDYEAEHNGVSGFSDQNLPINYRLSTVSGAYNLSSWRWQLLRPNGTSVGPIRTVIADCNTDFITAAAETPALAYVRPRHEIVRAVTSDVASQVFTYTP